MAKTKVELELLADIDMLLMAKRYQNQNMSCYSFDMLKLITNTRMNNIEINNYHILG